jgi:hypothetical protein
LGYRFTVLSLKTAAAVKLAASVIDLPVAAL